MDEVKTWADFGALSKEQLDGFAPEDLEALKTSIGENEANLAEDRNRLIEDAAKAKELAENYKVRAEKAEKLKKESRKEPSDSSLTQKDMLALTYAKVAVEDVDEVTKYAAYRGVSVADALKDKTLQTILADKTEERASAAASQSRSPRMSSQITGESILQKAREGQLPESEADMAKMVEAEFAAKKAKMAR